jgi:hypothetical protein
MYIPGEILGQGSVLELSGIESRSEIYTVKSLPGLFARNATRKILSPDMPPMYEDFAEALFRLSDEYGIEFPGIGCLLNKEDESGGLSEEGHAYVTAQVVDGFNMHHEMTEIPLDATMQTLDKILTYYEDMSRDFSSRLYLTDLSLRNCIYGPLQDESTAGDKKPLANFIDYDRRLSNISTILFSEPFEIFGQGFGGIWGLDDDLYALKVNYPDKNFDQIAFRLLQIANVQGIFYKVPTAYDQVNG